MNSGFLEIMSLAEYKTKLSKIKFTDYSFDCVIFHDVDLLPEDDRIMYTCPVNKPRHLSVAIDKFNYKIFYTKLVIKHDFSFAFITSVFINIVFIYIFFIKDRWCTKF